MNPYLEVSVFGEELFTGCNLPHHETIAVEEEHPCRS